MSDHDRVERAMRALESEHWHQPDHEAELLDRLVRVQQSQSILDLSDRGRRRFLLAGLLLGGVVTATTMTACGGWQWLREFFLVRVFDIQRGEDGQIEGLTLEDRDGQLLELRPIETPPGGQMPEPPVPVEVQVPRIGGGVLTIRVVRDGGLCLAPAFAADRGGDPEVGGLISLRPLGPASFRAEFQAGNLVLHYVAQDGANKQSTLRPVAGHPRRFSNAVTVLEILR